MEEVMLFLAIFILVYLIYLIFVVNRSKVLKKFEKGKELSYLKYRYKLNYDKINIKSLAHVVSLANALILAIVVTFVSIFDNFLFQMLIGLITLFPLILIIYHIIGKYYQEKEKRRKK